VACPTGTTNHPSVALGWIDEPPSGLVVNWARITDTDQVTVRVRNVSGSTIGAVDLDCRVTIFEYATP
jgi:hypothetical protein